MEGRNIDKEKTNEELNYEFNCQTCGDKSKTEICDECFETIE